MFSLWVPESSSLLLYTLLTPSHQPTRIKANHLASLGLSFPGYKMMGAVGAGGELGGLESPSKLCHPKIQNPDTGVLIS